MKEATEATRRKTNPLYNDRKLKLGTFSTNLEGGCAITSIDGTLKAASMGTATAGATAGAATGVVGAASVPGGLAVKVAGAEVPWTEGGAADG